AERELADAIIGAGMPEFATQELRNCRRRSRDSLSHASKPVEGRRPWMSAHSAMHAMQMGEACVPLRIGAPRDRKRRRASLGHHDATTKTHERQGLCAPCLAPSRAKRLERRAGRLERIEAYDLQALAGCPRRTLGCMNAVPHRRMRLLDGFKLHRHVVEMKE